MKYLFIGGTADGQRFKIPDEETKNPKFIIVSTETERHLYVPERFITGDLEILFFRFDEITVKEAITKLFKGYKP